MMAKEIQPTLTEWRVAFKGLRIQAEAAGVDVNTHEFRKFAETMADTIAQDRAHLRELYNEMHRQAGIEE